MPFTRVQAAAGRPSASPFLGERVLEPAPLLSEGGRLPAPAISACTGTLDTLSSVLMLAMKCRSPKPPVPAE